VRDTLSLARRMHPGQRNSLDALARRYGVDNSMRELHGALLDAQILADVYLAMTGGQVSLSLDAAAAASLVTQSAAAASFDRAGLTLVVLEPSTEEREAHEALLATLRKQSGRATLWDRLESGEADKLGKTP
jgi:DNA polymerase-3 subunit epsilon